MVNHKLELEDLDKQLAVVLQALEVAAKALKNDPSPVILSRWKEILAVKTKNLLLLEYRMYVGESVDEDWKSNSAESFELIGSVLKEVTLMERELDQKLEETSIDSSSVKDYIHNYSTPTTSEEGYCQSTPKIDLIDTAGGGATNSFKDYKAFRDKFQQFEGWKFIEGDNLNQFSSYFKFIRLYFFTHPSQISYICDKLSSDEHIRLTFDRGKMFEAIIWGSPLEGLDAYCSNSYQDQNCTGKFGYLFIQMCASSGDCLYGSRDGSQKVFNRGKLFEMARRYSYYNRSSSNFSFCVLDFDLVVMNELILMHNWNENFAPEPNSEYGYHFIPWLSNLNVFVFVRNGDSHDARKFPGKMLQHVILPGYNGLLLVTREYKPENTQEIFEQLFERDFIIFAHMEEDWKEFMEQEIISVSNTMLLVWKLNFQQLNLWVCLPGIELFLCFLPGGCEKKMHSGVVQSLSEDADSLPWRLSEGLPIGTKLLHVGSMKTNIPARVKRDISKIIVESLEGNIGFLLLNTVATVCHWFYTGQPRSILHCVMLFRASIVPAGNLLLLEWLKVLTAEDGFLGLHHYSLMVTLLVVGSYCQLLRKIFFSTSPLCLLAVYESHNSRPKSTHATLIFGLFEFSPLKDVRKIFWLKRGCGGVENHEGRGRVTETSTKSDGDMFNGLSGVIRFYELSTEMLMEVVGVESWKEFDYSLVLANYKRELPSKMVDGNGEFLSSQRWQVAFCSLQKFLTLTAISTFSSDEYHIVKVSIYKFTEVRVIRATVFHGLSCVTLVLLQQHQSWTTYELQLYIQVFSAFKKILNSAPGEGSTRDTRNYKAGVSEEFSIFTSFDSSFGYHTENIAHKFEGKLIMLVPFEEHKQHCPYLIFSDLESVCTVSNSSAIYYILVTFVFVTAILKMGLARVNIISDSKLMRSYSQVIVKEDIEQYKGMRDLQINLSSIEVALAFLYWLAVQLWLYDLVLFLVLECADRISSMATMSYQAGKMKKVGLLAEIPSLRFELNLLWALKQLMLSNLIPRHYR